MKANSKPKTSTLTPAVGTSILDQDTPARTEDISLAMANPAVGRIDAASRPDVRKPVPVPAPRPEPDTLDNEPTPLPVPRPAWGR